MRQYITIIFSCLVFLICLFLSRTILTALGGTLVFFLLVTLYEAVWRFHRSSWFPIIIRPAVNLLVVAILVLSFFALFFLPFEYQVTENWKITPKIPFLFGLSFLFFLVIILNLIDWNKLLTVKAFRLLLLIFVITCGFLYRQYHHEKLAREYMPKIYKFSPDWGIQATQIKVEGLNFFPVWKRGKLMVNDQETVINSWEDKFILAELPVPKKFGLIRLYVKRSDGIISNSVSFEIRDPDTLANF